MPMRIPRLSLLALLFAPLLTACVTVGPDYERPESPTPDAWSVPLARGLAEGTADLQTWWTVFEDPLLVSLVDRAVAGNLDLAEAVGRVREARAALGFARGEWYPDLDTVGDYTRVRTSDELSTFIPSPQDRSDEIYSSGFETSWELDLFGRIRRSVESSTASLDATVEDYRDVLVVLLADVSSTYVDVRSFQSRLRFARENVEAQRGSLKLTMDRNAAGLVGKLDVRQAELNLATTEAFIPQLEQALAAAIHRLGVLVGQPPGTLYAELRETQAIPAPPAEVAVSLPHELLRQRPDVRRAERALASQTARIGVAQAELYPRLSLAGSFTVDATDVGSWFSGGSLAYGFGPALRWNLFDGGRVRSNIRAEEARTEQALSRYENSVLFALQETQDALVAFVQESVRSEALARSATAAAESVKLVNELYRIGLTDFQNVLDSERSLFAQQDALAESEGLVSRNLITIYRSLGGGWTP